MSLYCLSRLARSLKRVGVQQLVCPVCRGPGLMAWKTPFSSTPVATGAQHCCRAVLVQYCRMTWFSATAR
jgi:hypothetical protein